MMEYEFPLSEMAMHGSDIIPLFTNNKTETTQLLAALKLDTWQVKYYADLLNDISPRFKKYFASFALGRKPNALSSYSNVEWQVADGSGEELANVLKVTAPPHDDAFELGVDKQNSKSKYDFWVNLAKRINAKGAAKEADLSANQNILLT